MVLSFIIRCGAVAGAIYYSRSLGVWGTSEETEQLYNNIKRDLRPHAEQLKEKLPFDVPALPESGEFSYLAKHYYNEGVKGTCQFVQMLPTYSSQLVDKAKEQFDKFSQAPPKSQ